MTSGGMPSIPGALPQARVSIALLNSSADGGMSSSYIAIFLNGILNITHLVFSNIK